MLGTMGEYSLRFYCAGEVHYVYRHPAATKLRAIARTRHGAVGRGHGLRDRVATHALPAVFEASQALLEAEARQHALLARHAAARHHNAPHDPRTLIVPVACALADLSTMQGGKDSVADSNNVRLDRLVGRGGGHAGGDVALVEAPLRAVLWQGTEL